ncbi:MAG: hypothetical protein M3R08_10470, partial [Bacteroidota bacterium]|nr:hypothetical protein [Bacteroidota bacterium]
MKKLYFLLIAILLIGTTSIYGQFQVVHDVPNTEMYPPTIRTMVTSDGGMITLQQVDSAHLFRKYDAQGGLLWNKVLQDTSALPPIIYQNNSITTMIRTDNGGCLFAQYVGAYGVYFEPAIPDSLWTYFNVYEIDGNGDVINAFQIEKFHHFIPTSAHTLELARMADGGIFLLVNYGDFIGLDFIELYKISAGGTVVWGRSIGSIWNNDLSGTNPTSPYSMDPEAKMTVDDDGIVYLTDRSAIGGGHMYITKLDPAGELVWMNQYNYSNTPTSVQLEGLYLDTDGKLHIGGALSNS